MQIDTKEMVNTGGFLLNSILHALTKARNGSAQDNELEKSFERMPNGKMTNFDVKLTINDIEVDIVGFFQRYEAAYSATLNRNVDTIVKDRVEQGLGEVFNPLEDLINTIKTQLSDDLNNKLGLKTHQDNA